MKGANNTYHTKEYYMYNNNNSLDMCVECDEKFIRNICNNCGFGICKRKQCSFQYEQYNKPDVVICKSCYDEIDEKLVLSVNYNQLRLLKKKIEEKVEKRVANKIDEINSIH